MKSLNSKLYMIAGMALCLGGTAMATPMGNLNIANCTGGGVTVSAAAITFSPAGTVAGTGCIATGIGTPTTLVTYTGGGPLVPGVTGNIKNLTAGPPILVDLFMTFTGNPNLDFQLVGLGPGVANTNCAGLADGSSCSVFAGSPFILTKNSTGTSVSLLAFGTVVDTTGTAGWNGGFTTQITGQTPDQIDVTICGAEGRTALTCTGSSIASTHSAQFTLTTIPEPASLSMLLLGGFALLGIKRIRKA